MSKICTNCGAEMDNDAYECPECLKKIPGAEIKIKQKQEEKKRKTKIAVILSLVIVLVVAIVTGVVYIIKVNTTTVQDKYVVPIKNYILGCEQNRYPRYLAAYTPYYAEMLDKGFAELTQNKNGEMYLNELYKSMLTKYGEDFKITYDIISEIQAPREVLDKYAEDYIKADFAEEGTVFSDGYTVKIRFTVSGVKATKQFEKELQLLELDGKWYMMDLVYLID